MTEKEIQLAKPEFLGEDESLVMIDDLYIEMTFIKYLGVALLALFVEFSYLGLKISWSRPFKFL